VKGVGRKLYEEKEGEEESRELRMSKELKMNNTRRIT
jgi:hypothetical protein